MKAPPPPKPVKRRTEDKGQNRRAIEKIPVGNTASKMQSVDRGPETK
jgi:hypothetical protein